MKGIRYYSTLIYVELFLILKLNNTNITNYANLFIAMSNRRDINIDGTSTTDL